MRHLFGNQLRDSSSSTSHVDNRQCPINRECCKGGKGLLYQRAVDFGIKSMCREGLKGKLIGLLGFKQTHRCSLHSHHKPYILCSIHSSSQGSSPKILLYFKSSVYTSRLESS